MIFATEPVNTMLAVPEPVIVTPPALAAVSVPLATLNVTVTGAAAASMSLMLKPLSLIGVSSVAA